jgi:hypothetical protein
MERTFSVLLALLVFTTVPPSIAHSDCVEDRHPVSLDDGKIVQFRSYSCVSEDIRLRVEFHRFADFPASILISGNTSDLLSEIVGLPQIIRNEVFSTYSSLLRQFGHTYEVGGRKILMSAEAGGAGGVGSGSDRIGARTIRVLFSPYGAGGVYPAIEEYEALKSGLIPSNMKYFYSIFCQDEPRDSDKPICSNFDRNFMQINFWRSMRADDVARYAQRRRIFDAQFSPGAVSEVSTPSDLQLLSYLAGSNWPPNLSMLIGNGHTDGCDGGFFYTVPTIILETALIENTSNRPVTVDNFFGGISSDTRLRVAAPSTLARLAASGNTLNIPVGVLPPGSKILLPTRIILRPDQYTLDRFGYRQTAAIIHRQKGASGYGGNAGAFEAPNFVTYVYGAEIGLGGFSVNGTKFDLLNRSANFMEMSMSSEEGSCPYLLSRQENESDWIDHGKVLHGASTSNREYTEVKVFVGLRRHFKLEEREPETAFIDQAELIIVLNDGRVISLKPNSPKLASGESDTIRLSWGDSVAIDFALPPDVAEADVTESRLFITGYYLRYPGLLARPKVSVSATESRP